MTREYLTLSEVGFDDEIAEYFYYNSKQRELEIGFGGVVHNGQHRAVGCSVKVTAWRSGKSRLHGSHQLHDLETNLGVVSLLLSIDAKDERIVMAVNTVDNRYVEWHFEAACLEIALANGFR